MSKMILINYSNKSSWESCAHLNDEIENVYRLSFGPELTVLKPEIKDELSYISTIKKIAHLKPETVIFADHRIENISNWIMAIKISLPVNHQIHWGIHAFGCFIGRIREWISLKEVVKFDPLMIVCASEAHTLSVRTFFIQPDCVKTFHIPFELKNSGFDEEQRREFRSKYNIADDELALVYTGRISFQKNVHHLVKLVRHYKDISNRKIKFFICGRPDDINQPQSPHAYYYNYSAELFSESLNGNNFIRFLGHLDYQEIQKLNQGMDVALSLSTFDGEDYGRSLVEALASGLPVIATAWGGFRELASLGQVNLCKVVLEQGNLKIDTDEFYQYLDQVVTANRQNNIIKFEEKFSPEKKTSELKELYLQKIFFEGFNKNPFIYITKSEQKWSTKEFFEKYEQTLYPYWT